MKEKPILFNGEMVRAILDGRKTQTRRIMKPQVEAWGEGWQWNGHAPNSPYGAYASTYKNPLSLNIFVGSSNPYGKKGDGLWVRETWRTVKSLDRFKPIDLPSGYSMIEGQSLNPPIEYLATPHNVYEGKTRVSIHMPRWASRINLEITDIRVERVQDISREDAMAEGITEYLSEFSKDEHSEAQDDEWRNRTTIENFHGLWDSINGKPRIYKDEEPIDISWNANPWVWVVCFKVVK